MDSINGVGAAYHISISINATGDGLLITDTSGGTGNLTIAEANNGHMAEDLGLLGASTGTTLDGSFEKSITINESNTLGDVRDAINALGLDLKATVINDGSNNPYRLSIASSRTGVVGRMVIGSTVSSLNLNTSVGAQNATLIMGEPTAENALFMSSSTNTVTNLVPGVSLALKTASADPITLSISTDPDSITTAVKDFTEKYNTAIAAINDQLHYDTTNMTSGPLFGDSTLMLLQQQIYDTINRSVEGVSGEIGSAGQVGLNLGLDGTLTLDETTLKAVLDSNLSDVVDFFTFQNNDALAAAASASSTDAPWTLAGGHDGNTRITDFASGTTGWQADNGTSYELDFGSKKELTSVRVYGIDTVATDILKSFDVQYWDASTLSWITYRSVADNTQRDVSIFFPTGIVTDKIRLNNIQGTGSKAKLLDLQAMEPTGFAATYDLNLSKITDSGEGMIVAAIDGSADSQTMIDEEITSLEERLSIEEARLRAQYTKLETMLSDLKNQSATFASQLNGINSAWGWV
jgi:flagellar hook-associated protein 2